MYACQIFPLKQLFKYSNCNRITKYSNIHRIVEYLFEPYITMFILKRLLLCDVNEEISTSMEFTKYSNITYTWLKANIHMLYKATDSSMFFQPQCFG